MTEPVETEGRLGTDFVGYRIDTVVGRGGMGVVYQAHDLRLKRNVALKLIAPEYAQDERFRERFLTETELAASLEHPDVVPIYDAGEVDGQLYLAMRLVEGSDLRHLLAGERALEAGRALRIIGQVADALDAAHERGLVHRDVKPSNVLLDEREHPYLADFGLIRRLDDPASPTAGLSVGTPAYVAPEQIRGDPADGRADQYALACMLHECLTGAPPFRRPSEVALLYAHLEDEPVPLGAPIDAVFARALAKDPGERYSSCAAFVQDAREALGIAKQNPSRWPFLAAAIVLAIAAAGLAVALLTGVGATDAPQAQGRLVRIGSDGDIAESIVMGTEPNVVALTADKAWVADRAEKTLSRIDRQTGQLELEAPAHGTPTDLAVHGGRLVLTHGPLEAGAVLFNTGTGGEEDSITLSAAGLSFGSPHVAMRQEEVWITTGDQSVSRLSIVHAGLGRSTTLPRERDEADSRASAIAADSDAVWVVGDPNQPDLWRVDPSTGRIVATVRLPVAPTDVAAGLGGVWVTSQLQDIVVRIDPTMARVTDSIPVGRGADAVAVGGESVWVANEIDGTVSRIDPNTLEVETIDVEGSPTDIAADGEEAWVTTRPLGTMADDDAIAIGVIASCEGPFAAFGELSFAAAELPLIDRGASLRGRKPAAGITKARVAGKDVELRVACGDDSPQTALATARWLVEGEGVDILLGSTQASEAFAIREYARSRPEITFLNGTAYPQALTLRDAAPNFFRFTPDGAQWMAGLGAYAYRDLGWRRAVTVGDDWLGGYIATAGFAAEFCALGGKIVKRIWTPLGATDLSRFVAQVPRKGVDGFLMADVGPASQAFIEGLPQLRQRLEEQIVGTSFMWSLADAGLPVGEVVNGETLGAQPRNSEFLDSFRRVFPDLAPFAWDIWSVYFYVPMEAALQALERVDGDLSDGQATFRAALANVELDAPNGRLTLDKRRQAIGPGYLVKYRKPASGGPPVVHTVRRLENVEQTFNGYFSPDDPPLGRDTIRCKKGNPPPWAHG